VIRNVIGLAFNKYAVASALIACSSVGLAQAETLVLDFDSLSTGVVLDDLYKEKGIIFENAKVFSPADFSNPPKGNKTNFILPVQGFNINSSFSIAFSNTSISDKSKIHGVSFEAYLGEFGDVHDSVTLSYRELDGKVSSFSRTFYDSPSLFNIRSDIGIANISIYNDGVNGFDNFSFDIATIPTIPELDTRFLLLSGLGLFGVALGKGKLGKDVSKPNDPTM
jgi:hypothetical protein